jgi:hypothetical protein
MNESVSNSSKLTEAIDPTSQDEQDDNENNNRRRNRVNAVSAKKTDKIPFSFPDLTDNGAKKFNLLVIGPQIPEILQGIRKQAAGDEKCRGVFTIHTESTLVTDRPFVEFNEQAPIHFVLIMMKASNPAALTQAAQGLRCLDPVFLARKRVTFCMSRQTDFRGLPKDSKESNSSKIGANELKAFCNTAGTTVHHIYFDHPESVAFGSKLIYNQIKRLLSNPCC